MSDSKHAPLPRSGLRWQQLLLGCLLAPWAWPALAGQGAAPCALPPNLPATDASLVTLRQLAPTCQKDASFLYTLGSLLNHLGRYDQAIDPLEAALLHRPSHLPTEFEYAIALEGAGDHASATGLLHNLLQNPATDPATKKQIATFINRQPAAPRLPAQATLSLATGYDDNLLGSTFHTQMSLTTPSGPLPVTLDASQHPQPGSFVRADLSYFGQLGASAPGQAIWQYGLDANHRASPGHAPAELSQASVMLERSTPGNSAPYALAQYQTLLRAGSTTVKQTLLGLGYDFAASCHQRLGLDLQHLRYPDSPLLNSRYTGLIGQTRCPAWGLQVQWRAGHDQPAQPGRPGGSQSQQSLQITKHVPLKNANLMLQWQATRQQDHSGYSPLLGHNAPRHISRNAYRLEYRWLAGGVSPYVNLEWLDQRANLPLFDLNNRILTVGFRTNW